MTEHTDNVLIAFEEAMALMGLNGNPKTQFNQAIAPTIQWLETKVDKAKHPFVLGVSGAQGSGKSTFCRLLESVFQKVHGWTVVTVSVDDLYLTRAEREALGQTVHPLCAIRGLFGTHDVTMGLQLIESLKKAGPNDVTRIPRFDKAIDDRVDETAFDTVEGRPDLVLFEGWCLGGQPGAPWDGPINDREARDDPDGRWYRWTETKLLDYQALWALCDGMVMLKVPSFQSVVHGRWRQEQQLRARASSTASGVMTRAQVEEYVALFERKTTQLLKELPETADLVFDAWRIND